MDDKIGSILNKIKSDFPEKKITYHFANELHTFRIEGKSATHWLYIDRDYVDDADETDLINLINQCGIIDILRESKKSKWLYLYDNGVREVNDNFAK